MLRWSDYNKGQWTCFSRNESENRQKKQIFLCGNEWSNKGDSPSLRWANWWNGIIWRWWGITLSKAKTSHITPQATCPPPQNEEPTAPAPKASAPKSQVQTADKIAAAHSSTAQCRCHHRQPRFSGHICPICTKKTRDTIDIALRRWALCLHCRPAKRSGGTTTATWMISMLRRVCHDLSICNLQAKNRHWTKWGTSAVTLRVMISMVIKTPKTAEASQTTAPKSTNLATQAKLRPPPPSVASSSRPNSTWVPSRPTT